MPHRPPMRSPHRLTRLAAVAALLLATAGGAGAQTYNWTGGTFAGGITAPNPLGAGEVLNLNAGIAKTFSGAGSNFTNGGTVNWNADSLLLSNGVTILNQGLWNATGDHTMFYNGGSQPTFTNSGTFRKSGGAGSTVISSSTGFVNSGTIDAQSGTIGFVGGSVFNAGSVFTGAGSVVMSNGTNTFNGALSSANLVLSSGVHAGNNASIGGTVTWTGGNLSGGWEVGAGQTLSAQAGGNKIVDGAGTVLTNKGTVAWGTTNSLLLQNGAKVRNQGLFAANENMSIAYNGGSQPQFDNTGTVRVAAGKTLTVGSSTGFVNNAGTLEAQAGATLNFVGGSVFNAGSVFTGAGSVVMSNGTNTFNGALSSANLVLSSGVHAGNNASIGGTVTWTGGNLSGGWEVGAGQTLSAQAGGNKIVDGAGTVLTNKGTVAWGTTNSLLLQNGAKVRNQGLFAANENMSIAYNGGSQPQFDNTGTVRVAAGKTLTVGSSTGFVNNAGTLEAQAGATLNFVGGSVFNAGSVFTGAGSVVMSNGTNTFNGALSSANLVLSSGVHAGNNASMGGTVTWTGGNLSGGWEVGAGQTLSAQAGGNKIVDGAGTVLTNKGTVAWGTTNSLLLQNGAKVRNEGTIDLQADAGAFYNGGSAPSFVNAGLIVKTGGSGTSTIGNTLGFDNQGTIDVRSGTVALPTNFTNQGTLKGTGAFSVTGTLTNAGTVAPGASPGTLDLVGSFAQTAAGLLGIELETTASHDLLRVSGAAALGGTLALSCYANCSFGVGDIVTILDSVGDLSGSFASVTLNGFATGAFNVIYDTAADAVRLQVTQGVTAAVPEPGTYALMLAGLLAVGGMSRRRARADTR